MINNPIRSYLKAEIQKRQIFIDNKGKIGIYK
jgi:hypothetical protein